jgi:hypothetical protein
MASRFSGKQRRGALALRREILREEAAERQKNVKHDNTKAHRLGRCGVHDETER